MRVALKEMSKYGGVRMSASGKFTRRRFFSDRRALRGYADPSGPVAAPGGDPAGWFLRYMSAT